MSEIIRAPWTADQVRRLNACQYNGMLHEFTCGNCSSREPLTATRNGWCCEQCGYRQDWCHSIQLEDKFCYGKWEDYLSPYADKKV